MDNHCSNISAAAIEFCKTNYIDILTIPPHTSHKLQPLDVAFFSAFKTHFSAECDVFMVNNPGKKIQLHNLGDIVGKTLLQTETTKTASNGFARTGIWPYNPLVFDEEDFLPASVFQLIDLDEVLPEDGHYSEKEAADFLPPSAIMPLPVAFLPKGRKRGSSILIQTEEKETAPVEKKSKQKASPQLVREKQTRMAALTDTECLYCGDTFANSRSKEKWTRCRKCGNWAHNECAGISRSLCDFICELCSTD
jgi:hypothetical protein